MTKPSLLVIVAAAHVSVQSAHAHGIAGNRYFAGTITFDDPAVADEAILPSFSTLNHPAEGGNVSERFNWSFDRLLTPTVAVTFDGGWINRNWGTAQSSGLDTANVGIKAEVFRNNQHEALISAGLAWGIGRSGAAGVDANGPNTVQPGVFFGKGFGDLSDQAAWLRPFAVTGAIVDEIPVGTTTGTTLVPNLATGMLQSIQVPKVETLHWGFSVQYSTYYLTNRFTGGPPKAEPLNQFVPLVEFAFDNPRTGAPVATMNPGFAYVAVAWQVAAEAIVPINRESGNATGFRVQLLFFIDDALPSIFGKPLLSDQPDRSLTAWH